MIVAPADDEHAVAVAAALDGRVRLVPLDAEQLTAGAFHVEEGRIEVDGVNFPTSTPTRAWLRRYAPPGWRHGLALDSHDGVVKTAWLTLLAALVRTLSVEWLSEPYALTVADGKLEQLAAARRLGIRVPQTAVVSDPTRIPSALGREIVVKPLGPADYLDENGEARVVFAGVLDRNDPRLCDLPAAPFLLQTAIRARQHLRVVVAAEKVWVCGITAEGRPFDWRQQDEARSHGEQS